MAPWEVTRVVRGGLVFYPKGDSDAWGDRILELNNDIYWMQDYNQPTGSARKSFSDGSEGWTAFVWQDGVQGYMLIKKYEDIPANASAPDQGEVEIYLSDNYWYIEVETQGRYGSISTDKPMVWTMVWYPRQISKNISVVKGNAELVSLVRSIVK